MAEREGERFDEILTRLQGVVEKLEGGQTSLEDSLAAFEEGVRLARRGQQILDAAEKKVEILTRADGEVVARPLALDPGPGAGAGPAGAPDE